VTFIPSCIFAIVFEKICGLYNLNNRLLESLERRRDRLATCSLPQLYEKLLEKVLKTMKLSAENLSLKDKQKVIRLVVEKVVVSPTKVRIIHCISPQMIDQEFCQLSLNGAG